MGYMWYTWYTRIWYMWHLWYMVYACIALSLLLYMCIILLEWFAYQSKLQSAWVHFGVEGRQQCDAIIFTIAGKGKGKVVGCAVHCTDSSSWYNTQRCHLAVARNPMHTQQGTHTHTESHTVSHTHTHTHKSSAVYVNRRRAKLAIRPRSRQCAQKGVGGEEGAGGDPQLQQR